MNSTYRPTKLLASLSPREYASYSCPKSDSIWIQTFAFSDRNTTHHIYTQGAMGSEDIIHVFGDGTVLHERNGFCSHARLFNMPRRFNTQGPLGLFQAYIFDDAVKLLKPPTSLVPPKAEPAAEIDTATAKSWIKTCEIIKECEYQNVTEWRALFSPATAHLHIQAADQSKIQNVTHYTTTCDQEHRATAGHH